MQNDTLCRCAQRGTVDELAYLEEEGALVLGLWAGGPEPVREGSGLGGGDEVAQGHGLLQDVQGLLVGLHAVRVVALRRDDTRTAVDNRAEAAQCSGLNEAHYFDHYCDLVRDLSF